MLLLHTSKRWWYTPFRLARVSQSKYGAQHVRTQGNCIQHTKQQTLDRRRKDHNIRAMAKNGEKKEEEVKKRRRGRRKKKSTTSSPGPRCKRSLSVSPESELRGASELPLYIRWTDFKLSLLRLSRKLKASFSPLTHHVFFFSFSL